MAYAPFLFLPVRDAVRLLLKGIYAPEKKEEFTTLLRTKEKNSEVCTVSEFFLNNVFYQIIMKWECSVAA
jgi:hypothetical protein